MGLESHVVSPEHDKGQNTAEHAEAGQKRQRAIRFKELSIDRWAEEHETDEGMDEHQQEARHAEGFAGIEPTTRDFNAEVLQRSEPEVTGQQDKGT